MATKRFGYLDDLSLKNQKVGIGTSTANEKLEVLGGTRGENVVVTGIATLTSYSGFQNKNTSYTDNITIDSGESGTLSGEIVIGAGLTMSVGTGATTGQGNVKSLKVSNTFTPPIGGINDRPSAPKPGSLFYNKDFKTIEYWDGSFWRQVEYTARSGRAVFAGGTDPAVTRHVNYIQIPTQGDTINFGELITASQGRAGLSDGKRGITCGGYNGSGGMNEMDYFTLASEGNGIDFGNLTASRWYCRGASSSTRGVVSGGSNAQTTMDYVEIATTGNAISFGTMPQNWNEGASCQSPTRGFFLKHSTNSGVNTWTDTRTIWITIASKGAGTRWNDLTTSSQQGHQAVSNNTRAVMSGGDSNDNAHVKYMEYWNMDSLGITNYFGDLTVARGYAGQGSTQTRGVFYGGALGTSPNYTNIIDYVTFATAGNAVDFGDIDLPTRATPAGMSDSHGGLGGF